ncbi:Thymidylate kinase [Steccherinum ochraceum]|uniref:Thymidylate kinase n=1 Tax=Steccherinum ochraceum TaxID=92696 RepID=A0A4R0RH29_9APHY|nr:Thymidylate kinase [Steccherinum ochraceum]
MSKRGAFVVIEGLDRSGKSTQAATLIKRLQESNVPSKLIKFPDRTTPIGKLIDSYLRSETELDDHAIHLLFSANRWEVASSIVKDLENGTTVICDRYAFSGIAFSASKVDPSSKPVDTSTSDGSSVAPTHSTRPPLLPYSWCRAPDVSLPAPDLTLFLDILPHIASQRAGYGGERYENQEHQERVRELFSRIAEEVEAEGVGRWVVLDGGLELKEVEEAIWREVKEALRGGDDGELGSVKRLWDKDREGAVLSSLYI